MPGACAAVSVRSSTGVLPLCIQRLPLACPPGPPSGSATPACDVPATRRLRRQSPGLVWRSMPRISSAVAVDVRWETQLGAWLNIIRTLFICVAIYAGTVIFNHDASRLVLQPIQRMLKQVPPSPGLRTRASLSTHGPSCSTVSPGTLRVGVSPCWCSSPAGRQAMTCLHSYHVCSLVTASTCPGGAQVSTRVQLLNQAWSRAAAC